jgi:hypothetical protein
MKKAGKQSSNAADGAAARFSQGIVYSNEDLWKDDLESEQPVKSKAQPSSETTGTTQRRRPRKNKT